MNPRHGVIFLSLMMLHSVTAQTVLTIDPDVPGSVLPINQVTFNDSSLNSGAGGIVIQTGSQATSVNNQRSTPVTLVELGLVGGGSLDVFNIDGARITLGNLATNPVSGVGVLQSDGTQIASTEPGFANAILGALQSSNINEYIYYDGPSAGTLPSGTTDYTIQFRFAFEPTDAILVQERNGNTFFQLTPLDINGNVISGANVLQFAEGNSSNFSGYQWNSGFANSFYQNDQEFAFSVASISKFFEGTSVPAAQQVVFGFAVDNDGNADTKFFGASDNPFTNNPFDPSIPGSEAIPEPSSTLLLLLGSLATLHRRR